MGHDSATPSGRTCRQHVAVRADSAATEALHVRLHRTSICEDRLPPLTVRPFFDAVRTSAPPQIVAAARFQPHHTTMGTYDSNDDERLGSVRRRSTGCSWLRT